MTLRHKEAIDVNIIDDIQAVKKSRNGPSNLGPYF